MKDSKKCRFCGRRIGSLFGRGEVYATHLRIEPRFWKSRVCLGSGTTFEEGPMLLGYQVQQVHQEEQEPELLQPQLEPQTPSGAHVNLSAAAAGLMAAAMLSDGKIGAAAMAASLALFGFAAGKVAARMGPTAQNALAAAVFIAALAIGLCN